MTPHRAVAIAAALSLAGCVSPSRQEAAFAAGWRAAKVIEVAPSAEIAGAAHDCRRELPAPTPEAPYAVLRYAAGSRHHRVEASAVVPASAALQPGAWVCLNLDDCGVAPVPIGRAASNPSCVGMRVQNRIDKRTHITQVRNLRTEAARPAGRAPAYSPSQVPMDSSAASS